MAGKEPIARNLPPTPGFARPVSIAEPRDGEPLLAVASRERVGRKENAAIINRFRGWYGGVRREYGAK
jgi:hypothetical protein